MTLSPRLLAHNWSSMNSPIHFLDKPTVDYLGQATIGYYGGWVVMINAMLANDRLCLKEPSRFPGHESPVYGWCYKKGGAAHLAALAWDPETAGEPPGHHNAVTSLLLAPNEVRQAGERAEWWRPPMW